MATEQGTSADRKRNIGCAAAAVVVVALIVVVGMMLGKKDEAAKSPCERYTAAVVFGLKNCHSGQTKNYSHHMTICKESVAPTDACIRAIESLSCEQLEMDPAGSAGEACARK